MAFKNNSQGLIIISGVIGASTKCILKNLLCQQIEQQRAIKQAERNKQLLSDNLKKTNKNKRFDI